MKTGAGHKKSISIRHFLFVLLFPLIVLLFGNFIGEFSTEMIDKLTNWQKGQGVWDRPLQLFINSTLVIGIAVFILWEKEKRGLTSLGLAPIKGFMGTYLRGWLIGMGLLLMVAFGVVGLGYGQIKGYGISKLDLFPFILAILAWAMQGASEELIMRGYMFNDLRGKSNISLALIISSTYFAWLHLSNNGITPLSFINIILAGLFFAFYYLKEGNLWGACGFHSAWNFAQENLLGLPVSGHRIGGGSILELKLQEQDVLIAGGLFGLEGSIVCTAVLLIGSIILWFHIKNKDLIDRR